ncbi:hypothetical protein [Paraburkholderia sp. J11-2]|uniref:hypothetical protein n=1 Tax=Paraburkholderia sp. J11-2 TaxID=2805431 RepID=UPI002AB6BD7A|nr:hypothetical protein [Paraburkholderia sp. J11-2]
MAARDIDMPTADAGGSYETIPRGPTLAPSKSLTLCLGVFDVSYSNHENTEKVPQAKKGKANKPIKPKSDSGTKTTGDVAEILEEKYGVMDAFMFAHEPDVAHELEDALAGELENMLMGAPLASNPFQKAESAITAMFKQFLSTAAIEHMGIESVPTLAALDGVNHRLKHPYAKGNPRRPSFIDTGMYQSHFVAWVK